MMEVPINQKEYLKKYLGIGKAPGEKKKKKKKPTTLNRVQIIDDDADVNIPSFVVEDELANEYAPQIVAIIDERPLSLRIDEKTNNPLWQPIGTANDDNANVQKQAITSFKIGTKQDKSSDKFIRPDKSPPKNYIIDDDYSPPRKSKKKNSPPSDVIIKEEIISDDDNSPRSGISRKDTDYSPSQNIKQEIDASPPRNKHEDSSNRKSQTGNYSPPRRINRENDISPPRRRKKSSQSPRRSVTEDRSSFPRQHNDDNSPPRRRNENSSQIRRGRIENDISPPRRRRDDNSPPRRNRKGDGDSSRRRNADYENKTVNDISPHRRQKSNKIDENFAPRKRKDDNVDKYRSRSKIDNSPIRRNRSKDDDSPSMKNKREDNSPARRSGTSQKESKYSGSPSIRKKTSDESPGRRQRRDDDKTEEGGSKKMEKTLDGKSAGLQNARELMKETRNFKNREDNMFKNLSRDVSGQNAQTVHRDRKTGRIRNIEEEEERQKKKREEEEKNKEKYTRWGKGLAQVESREQQLQEQLHEMSKPLARYADDEDLERYLKEQEREGDPMLAYIRKKKRKKMAEAGVEVKPQFEGEFMPNRYGIRPGHRWDGVDRSNGYEKKWFEVQNQKRAVLEDSYKWSTEDM